MTRASLTVSKTLRRLHVPSINLRQYSSVQVWGIVNRLFLITLGSMITAFGYTMFQTPFNLAAGGLSGLGIIINHFTGWPVGTLFFVMNMPMMILGYYGLGRWQFIWSTLLAVVVWSVTADAFGLYLPMILETYPVTDDMLLSAIYAGLVVGIGMGLIYRAGATSGGTTIPGRICSKRRVFRSARSFSMLKA